jgi:hypothetical protein
MVIAQNGIGDAKDEVRETQNGKTQASVSFEISSSAATKKRAGGNPLVRTVSGSSTFVVNPGKKEVVISADDVNTRRRYQVEVVATRLN